MITWDDVIELTQTSINTAFSSREHRLWKEDIERSLLPYSDPRRKYHNQNHIISMLESLFAEHPRVKYNLEKDQLKRAQMILAIVFHDVVYDPRNPSGVNEINSFLEFDNLIGELGMHYEVHQWIWIKDVILGTTHKEDDALPLDNDGKFILDLDLEGLSSYFIYLDNQRKIKDECLAFGITEDEFNKGRKAFLQTFLNKKDIYYNPYSDIVYVNTDSAKQWLSIELIQLTKEIN